MPLVVGIVAVAAIVLVVVPVVVIVADVGPGGDGPEQTPFVTDDREVAVAIRDFTFIPEDLTLEAGTTVTWVNEDSAPHDATDRAGGWKTDVLDRGESNAVTFDTVGTFEYYCSIHPWMEGVVTVH